MKLDVLPDDGVIVAMRRRADIYVQKGQVIARGWPRKKSIPRTAAEIASSQRFTAAVKSGGLLPAYMVEAYKKGMVGVGVTWLDRQRALALGKPWEFVA